MKVLVVDVGGTHVKILATGQRQRRKFESGPTLTPQTMVSGVRQLARGWKYDVVTVGYPGLVLKGRIAAEPYNLAPGWIGFDIEGAFGRPVRIVNDAAMQALGSYAEGRQREEARGHSARLQDGREHQCIRGRLPHLGRRDRAAADAAWITYREGQST